LHVLTKCDHGSEITQIERHVTLALCAVGVVSEHRVRVHCHGCVQGVAAASCA
jgi:hypothetical protein